MRKLLIALIGLSFSVSATAENQRIRAAAPLLLQPNGVMTLPTLTTKGDLMGFGSAYLRVPVGADGRVLTADSSQPSGLSWTSPAPDPVWGSIIGTLSDQTDLQSALNAKQNSLTIGNLTSPTTGVSVSGGTGSVIGSGAQISVQTASGTQPGLLSAADWTTFNNKLGSGTLGDLTSPTSGVSVSGGTGAVVGAGTAISIQTASGSQNGLLSSADWTTFNSKQNALTTGNLTTSTTGVSLTGATGAVIGSGATINIQTASGTQPGLLSSADWTTFNNKLNALTLGNLTSSTTGVTFTGGTGAVVGSGTSIAIQTASGTQPGLLSSADWTTFNNKLGPGSFGNLTSPTAGVSITGGTGAVVGAGAAISIQSASGSQPGLLLAADWTTFNSKQNALALNDLTSGTTGVSITGGTGAVVGTGTSISVQTASGAQPGLLSAADWTTFNSKQNALTIGNVTSPTTGVSITGGTGAVIGTGTAISIQTASGVQPGLLSSADWTTFNSKQNALTIGNITSPTTGVSITGGTGAVIGAGAAISIQTATTSQPGLLSAADWTTFNGKQNALTLGNLTSPTTGVTIGTGTARLVGGNSTITIQNATAAQPGLLTAADFTTFNAKQAPGNYITGLTGEVTAAGPGSVAATIAANAVTTVKINDQAVTNAKIANAAGIPYSKLSLTGSVIAADVNSQASTNGQVLTSNGAAGATWANPGAVTLPTSVEDFENVALSATVAANAMTVRLRTKAGIDPSGGSPVSIGMRVSPVTSGIYVNSQSTAATSIVIPSGATLGLRDNENYAFVYALNNAGVIELAVTAIQVNESILHSTVAISSGSTLNDTLYSTTARSNVAVRCIGKILAPQTTSGVYAAAPTSITVGPLPLERIVARREADAGNAQTFNLSTSVVVSYNATLRRFDPTNSFRNTTTFTAPRNMNAVVTAFYDTGSIINNQVRAQILVNGSSVNLTYGARDDLTGFGSSTNTTVVNLVKGDTVELRATNDSVNTTINNRYLAIAEIL